ncbi:MULTISPECIES: outer membrane protein [unclassified Xanthobacter]|uniref:outer membrane protein n=1 Tax=unclassified Xanthobacter TaxID=2623496 RepID=UPI001F34BBB4|nr:MULTISPECIES: hypothetical protein [unclassified Xanthobacter]
MKLVIAASTALVLATGASAGSAIAADFSYPIKGTLAPAPLAGAAGWTGFYLGGALGATFANTNADSDVFNFSTGNVISYDNGAFGSSSFSTGVYAGYNFQLDTFVLGVEGEATWLNAAFDNGNDFGAFADSDWQFAISGRIGYLVTPTALVFTKVGWAFTNVSVNSSVDGIVGWPATGAVYNDGYRNGLLLGAGIEALVGGNWLLRVEGEYTLSAESASMSYPAWGVSYNVKPDFLTARLGLAYKF